MAISLTRLAEMVGGTVVGSDVCISGAATMREARPGDVTFIDCGDRLHRLSQSAASAALVPRSVTPDDRPAIQVDDVPGAFARIVRHFRPPRPQIHVGLSPLAVISPTARIGPDVDIHPGATVGDDVEIGARSTVHAGVRIMAGCRLGEDVTVFPNAVLYENTVVGRRVIIHAGAVLGAYGFGYSLVDGRHQPSCQLGYVDVADDVEIGASTTIDRGTYGPTSIGEGTKIDNQVMVAHNCRLGRHNLICSQVGIAGSSTTGDYVVMAGQVGVRDHIHIGDRAVVGAKAGVPNDVPADAKVFGIPARPAREQKRIFASISKLPELRRQVKALEAALDELKRHVAAGSPRAQNEAA